MNIVVTGGSGFIGSHLVDVLLEQGHRVKIYDIEPPRYGQACEFIKADVLDPARLVRETKGFEAVYHLAAEANVYRFFDSPVYSNDVTATSTLHVLEAARANGLGRVLLASTEWVYGSRPGAAEDAVTEDAPYADDPDHVYTASKVAAELFCKSYRRLYDVPSTIMRFGIPFGERGRPETVTPTFIRKILRGEEITVHGDGSQTRQFIYVKDLARGCAACLAPAAAGQAFNLNGRERIAVIDVIRRLEEVLERPARVRFGEERANQFKGRLISSDKAKAVLGWEPRFSYPEALRHYVRWFLAHEASA